VITFALGVGLKVSALRENSSEKRDGRREVWDVNWWEKFANRREKSRQEPSSVDDGDDAKSWELERRWGQMSQEMEPSPVGLVELERSWG